MIWWRKFSAFLFLFLLLSGCGGGGGGSSTSPVASNFILQTSEAGTVNARFDYSAPNGGVSTVTSVLYDATGKTVRKSTDGVSGIPGNTSGTLRRNYNFSSFPPGDYSVEVYFTDVRGVNSNRISRQFTATGSFGPAVNYPNPSKYLYMGDTAIGDLNGDGRNDVVAIQGSNNTGELLIYYQDATGKLQSPVVMNLDIVISKVVVADVNNDGKADVVLAGESKNYVEGGPGRVVIVLQDPTTGQLLPPQEYILSNTDLNPSGLAVGDLNGDGRNDIVVGGAGHLAIFYQNAAGTLDPEVTYDNLSMVGEIQVADMNNDGRNDIIVGSGAKQIAVIRQTAPGVFSATPDFYDVQTSYWPNAGPFSVGDVNGDGRNDIVALDPGNSGYLNIFLQNAQGTLNPPVLLPTDVPFGVRIADVTGDGLQDIIYDVSGGIFVMPQQRDHTFGPKTFYGYQSSSSGGSVVTQALSIGDVTGDGRIDAVLTWLDEGLYVFPFSTQVLVK